jgi:hypothetical protein
MTTNTFNFKPLTSILYVRHATMKSKFIFTLSRNSTRESCRIKVR